MAVYVAATQRMGLFMVARNGNESLSERNQSQTLRADPSSANFENTVRMAPVTASSGWKRTSPSPSPQTKPTGRPRRRSRLRRVGSELHRLPRPRRNLREDHGAVRPAQP